MVYPELVDYIRSAARNGYGREEVREALLDSGWTRIDVEDAFKVVEAEPAVARPLSERSSEKPFQPAPSEEQANSPAPFVRGMMEKRGENEIEPPLVETTRLGSEKPLEREGGPASEGVRLAPTPTEEASFSRSRAWGAALARPFVTLRRARYHSSYFHALSAFASPVALLLLVAGIAQIAGIALPMLADAYAQVRSLFPAEVVSSLGALGTAEFAGVAIIAGMAFGALCMLAHVPAYFLSRVLGGRGNYGQQSYLSAVAFSGGAAAALVGIVLYSLSGTLFAGSPMLELATKIAAAALAAYGIAFLQLVANKEAHLYSYARAFCAVLLVPLLVGAVLYAAGTGGEDVSSPEGAAAKLSSIPDMMARVPQALSALFSSETARPSPTPNPDELVQVG